MGTDPDSPDYPDGPDSGDRGQVAVKVLRPELADDPEFRARFGREVASLMRVRGECTVRVVEADTESSQPFMVTEYTDGPSLSEYIDTGGPLGADMLYGLATGLAEALAAIHAAGVVHRDLKPSNVILGWAGWPTRLPVTTARPGRGWLPPGRRPPPCSSSPAPRPHLAGGGSGQPASAAGRH